jgi:pyruvate/2-oxoglutarate dehydrogenase complex dihydrolipoamide dehydrogenase (E3) component
MTVALVERHLVGGTCVNTGCMPTKTLVASARAAHVVRRAADFGVTVGGRVGIDIARVKARASAVSKNSRTNIETRLKELPRCTFLRGHARLESKDTVRVGDELLSAERLFLNVGGRPIIPAFPGVAEAAPLTSSSLLACDELPAHLVVVGGSYVGLELAQIYRRLGSEVTVIEKGPRIAGREDPDVSAAIQAILEREGIAIRVDATCIAFSLAPRGVCVRVDCASGDREVIGSHALVAVGRRPNTDDLDLPRAGVAVDAHGYILVDDQLRTNVPGIWALGECNGHGAFTHTAYNDFEIVAANLLDHDPRRLSDRHTAYALYIDPPLGRAGLTEVEARKSGRPFRMATYPMAWVGRAIEKDETQGFMKVLVDAKTDKLIGASILGTGGDEIIHELLDLMYAGATAEMLRRTVGIHPTVSELLPTVVARLAPAT